MELTDWVLLLCLRVRASGSGAGLTDLGNRCYIIFQVKTFLVCLCFETYPVVKSAVNLYSDALIFKAFV
jgi:hypothetical protein